MERLTSAFRAHGRQISKRVSLLVADHPATVFPIVHFES